MQGSSLTFGAGTTSGDIEKTWVAIISGLSVGSQEAPADLKVQLLVEWLMGENGGPAVSGLKILTCIH